MPNLCLERRSRKVEVYFRISPRGDSFFAEASVAPAKIMIDPLIEDDSFAGITSLTSRCAVSVVIPDAEPNCYLGGDDLLNLW